MEKVDHYEGREQTLVKHFILEKYLERFAYIVGSHWPVLTYVDCFSGPWNVRSDQFEDSSFAIALNQLRKVRDTYVSRGRQIQIRCLFLEKKPAAYRQLSEFARGIADATVETLNAELEESVDEIVRFVQDGGVRSFPFIFIDPTGWTGFDMDRIEPILRLNPSEVLINFMTGHIRRFLDSPLEETQISLTGLFGSDGFRHTIAGLAHEDRDDAAVAEYRRNLKRRGGYRYTCAATVLHPEMDRTHFHLIYATRNPKGVDVFKEIEKKAMAVQEKKRGEAHQRRRVAKTGQGELLRSADLHDSEHYDRLRQRYSEKSHQMIEAALRSVGRLPYDELWELALAEPMTWESDLKEWIKAWQNEGRVELRGLERGQRVPKRNAGNSVAWK